MGHCNYLSLFIIQKMKKDCNIRNLLWYRFCFKISRFRLTLCCNRDLKQIIIVTRDLIKHRNFVHLVNIFCYCQWLKLLVISCASISVVLWCFVTQENSTGSVSVRTVYCTVFLQKVAHSCTKRNKKHMANHQKATTCTLKKDTRKNTWITTAWLEPWIQFCFQDSRM